MIGARIKQARSAAGLSLRDLAAQVDVTAMAISKYERGAITPSSEVLLGLAKALGVRVEYFFRRNEVELEAVEYRKHPSLPERSKARILADVRDQLERWLALEEFIPTPWATAFRLPAGLPTKVSAMGEIEDVALVVRKAWQLGHGPILDLTDVLESRGIKVFATHIDGERKFDGLSATADGKPVIVVGKDLPGDRQRFTLGHELGHLILKGRLAKALDEEKACHRFAGALLVPAEKVFHILGKDRARIEPRELLMLKSEWGFSMGGWTLRARDLGVLSTKSVAALWNHFRTQGWDQREPDPQYPQEEPRRFDQLVYRALAEDLITESKAAELLGLPLMEFVAQRNMDVTSHAVGQ